MHSSSATLGENFVHNTSKQCENNSMFPLLDSQVQGSKLDRNHLLRANSPPRQSAAHEDNSNENMHQAVIVQSRTRQEFQINHHSNGFLCLTRRLITQLLTTSRPRRIKINRKRSWTKLTSLNKCQEQARNCHIAYDFMTSYKAQRKSCTRLNSKVFPGESVVTNIFQLDYALLEQAEPKRLFAHITLWLKVDTSSDISICYVLPGAFILVLSEGLSIVYAISLILYCPWL